MSAHTILHTLVPAESHRRVTDTTGSVGICIGCRGSGRVRRKPHFMVTEGIRYGSFHRIIPVPCPVCGGLGVWPDRRTQRRRRGSRRKMDRRADR